LRDLIRVHALETIHQKGRSDAILWYLLDLESEMQFVLHSDFHGNLLEVELRDHESMKAIQRIIFGLRPRWKDETTIFSDSQPKAKSTAESNLSQIFHAILCLLGFCDHSNHIGQL
jgi:hypothetical protein